MDGKPLRRIGAIELPVRRLHVELTSRCNFACEFCPDGNMRRPRGTMPLPMVERILTEAGREGVARQAHFHVMGEPLLHPDLPAAVRIARESGMEAWVTTNGSLLTPALLTALRQAGLSHLTVSVQTPDAATFALRGSRRLTFDEYCGRVTDAARAHLDSPGATRLSICFLANPLRRFRAPNPPAMRVAESGKELRAHMAHWVDRIFHGKAHDADRPRLRTLTRRAGILKECRISLTANLEFQVRILGNWAEHFARPVVPARFGYCPGLLENFGILWNGDYVLCCTDYDGRTSLANAAEVSLREYLSLPAVQEVAGGFHRYRVVHPYCRQCLGDRHPVSALCRQVGSIVYFKVYRRLVGSSDPAREAM
ncbi:MAG: radical SAM/SPASM domain-containing protein [Zetaproteobacteria bacterium]|nr:MAG: radical SAM/SPASM domain-containing protein [Zetaproteobacteria bacterium]